MSNILLIEDEADLRELFREILETFGHTVVAAANGDKAAALFDDSIELLVTDMNMPGKTGLQTAALLRERAPHLGVIVMSGHPGQSNELERFAQERAENRFLYKPFTPEVLCTAVTEMVQVAPVAA